MTDLLRDQLQATLGAAYTLERELGGGGTPRHRGRPATGPEVVVKIPSPPVVAAGAGAERLEPVPRRVGLADRPPAEVGAW